jgi:hypothetical protein
MPLFFPLRATCSAKSHYSPFYRQNTIGWAVQIIKPLIVAFCNPFTWTLTAC